MERSTKYEIYESVHESDCECGCECDWSDFCGFHGDGDGDRYDGNGGDGAYGDLLYFLWKC